MNDGLARVLATEPVDALNVMDDMLKVMSAQVTVRPSGHEFEVEGRETLLQAGMRAGLKLNYGCGNGSCGMCKVRVASGEVARILHTDYPLSQAEKSQGYVLACAHTAASSELVIETLEAAGPADIPEQQIVATVRAVRPLAPDTMLLHLQTPRSQRLRFLAGQSVTLGISEGGAARARLAVASCPCDDRNLHFFVARDPEDPLAARLFDGGLKAGDAVTVWGPQGEFALAEDAGHPLVFAACDTGFAPVKSLIEHALSLDAWPSVSLFWLATRPDGHFLANQCRAWSEALDPFEYALSSHADPGAGAVEVARAMRADLFDIDCAFYIAGPEVFVGHAARRAGRRRGAGGAYPHGGDRMSCACGSPAAVPAAHEDAGCSGGESFALRVLGDDMAPEFNEGDIIIVEPDGALKDGSFVLAQCAGRMDLPPAGPARRGLVAACPESRAHRSRRPAAAGPCGRARRRHPEGRPRTAQTHQALPLTCLTTSTPSSPWPSWRSWRSSKPSRRRRPMPRRCAPPSRAARKRASR